MHHQGAELFGRLRHDAGRGGVELARQICLALGLVHGRMRGGVDDDIGTHAPHRVGHLIGLAEVGGIVGAVEVERDQFAQRRQAALQLPADLAALAQQQQLHACTA